jgi:hypothetical protein
VASAIVNVSAPHDDDETEVSTQQAEQTQAFPAFIPMQYGYYGDQFYVRSCYAEYYEPAADDGGKFNYRVASRYVERLLLKRTSKQFF